MLAIAHILPIYDLFWLNELVIAIFGGTFGLVVGAASCAPITGMVGGACVAQDWGKLSQISV